MSTPPDNDGTTSPSSPVDPVEGSTTAGPASSSTSGDPADGPAPFAHSTPSTYIDRLDADHLSSDLAALERDIRAKAERQIQDLRSRDFAGQAAALREIELAELAASAANVEAANATPGDGAPPSSAAIAASALLLEPYQSDVNLTDTGNARRFVSRNGRDARFCPTWKTWLFWKGGNTGRWVRDLSGEVTQRAISTALSINTEAALVTGNDEQAQASRKAIRAWAQKSEAAVRINSMVDLAASSPAVVAMPDAFDRNPLTIGVPNGVYSFVFGDLLPDSIDLRKLHITKQAGARFDRHELAPRWEEFISEIMCGDAQRIEFLQRAIGYSLTGDVSEHVMFVLHGGGANGKSTLLEALSYVFGDYASVTPFETFTGDPKETGSANPSLASLVGARFVIASEVNEGRRLNEAAVKLVTGGDAVRTRNLYEKEFTFSPAFKVWLACNHKPQIRGTDDGIWRRIRLIPFEAKFDGVAKKKDPKLLARLKSEAPGILAWAIRGANAWRKSGLGNADAVLRATAEYRDESDKLGAFIGECCQRDPSGTSRVGASALYAAYKKWAEDHGEHPITSTAFGLRIKERGFALDPNSKRERKYVGLTIAAPS